MIWIPIVIIILAVFLLLFAFLVSPHKPEKTKVLPFYGRNIAHRGLFSKDQTIPENSIAAFNRACENGYGIELDVQLSADGQVVVFHDDTLNRMCGVDSRVDALNSAVFRSRVRIRGSLCSPKFSKLLTGESL